MKQQRNGGPKQSPEALTRIEAALESERRQREQLERRLRETEQRLEAALAAVQAPASNDAALLQLKSQLVAEMEAAECRAQLEQELLALELMANAAEEALAQPAHAAPAQRIIQYIHVPAPAVEAIEPTVSATDAASAPAAPPAVAPKDFENKLAAAQMAIDAAEARASHNAAQVRKLTEELAAARAEQIRLSAEVRDLAERFGTAVRTATPKAVPSLAPLAEAPIMATPAVGAPEETEEETIDLTAALADWGAPEVAEPELVATSDDTAAPADLLEDALSAFGDAPAHDAPAIEEHDAALEEALSAFGSDAPDSVLVMPEAESVLVEEVVTATPASAETPLEDSLLEVLEGWGSEPDKTSTLEVAPEIEVAAEEYGNPLEVDTLERLESPELPPEERISEALGDAVFSETLVTRDDELLEDVESAEVVEEEHRWEPTPAPLEEEELETIGAWSVLSPEDRLDEAALQADAAADIEVETVTTEDEPIVETPLDVTEQNSSALPASPPQESPRVEAVTPAPEAPPSRTMAMLEQAATQRREILAAKSAPEQEPASAPEEDFEPDLATLVRRGAAERPVQQPSEERAGRSAMIDALQQFIGE